MDAMGRTDSELQMIYLFDVDGTLTPSRGEMDADFKVWFKNFITLYQVSLVTGSDREKTVEQVGADVVDQVEYCFNCAGNAVYKTGELISQSSWTLPNDVEQFLANYLNQSQYPDKYGCHFEQRIGMMNFSVVGRNAVGEQRTRYYQWYQIHNERQYLVHEINNRWPNLQAAAGGETSIDIFALGFDKAQVIKYFGLDRIHFFGDKMDANGNDYTLAQCIVQNQQGWTYNVTDWKDTWNRLKHLCPHVEEMQ